jgi:dipeptidyl aminopeptidase/acylaminoacyl peptidase
MQRLVGRRWKDREELRAISPARNADKIRAPVFIAHGTEDWRVHVKQAHAMIDALEDAGVPVESHLYDGEVHGFLDERNRIDFHVKLAAFFERHLMAPKADAVPSTAALEHAP